MMIITKPANEDLLNGDATTIGSAACKVCTAAGIPLLIYVPIVAEKYCAVAVNWTLTLTVHGPASRATSG